MTNLSATSPTAIMKGHLTGTVMDDVEDGESGPEGQKLSATCPSAIMECHLTKSIMDDDGDGESCPEG